MAESTNGVTNNKEEETNGDVEPAAKRPKHEPTNGVAEEKSHDRLSSGNQVRVEPKKEVSCYTFFGTVW